MSRTIRQKECGKFGLNNMKNFANGYVVVNTYNGEVKPFWNKAEVEEFLNNCVVDLSTTDVFKMGKKVEIATKKIAVLK